MVEFQAGFLKTEFFQTSLTSPHRLLCNIIKCVSHRMSQNLNAAKTCWWFYSMNSLFRHFSKTTNWEDDQSQQDLKNEYLYQITWQFI